MTITMKPIPRCEVIYLNDSYLDGFICCVKGDIDDYVVSAMSRALYLVSSTRSLFTYSLDQGK